MAPSDKRDVTLPVRRGDLMPNPDTGYVGLLGLVVGLFWLQLRGLPEGWAWLEPDFFELHWRGVILVGLVGFPMLAYEWIMLRIRAKAGLSPAEGVLRCGEYNLRRTGIKYLGLVATVAAVAFLYWTLPVYHAGFVYGFHVTAGPFLEGLGWEGASRDLLPPLDERGIMVEGAHERGSLFYRPYFVVAWTLGPIILLLAPLYIYWVDARLKDPHDTLWKVGRLVLGHHREMDRGTLLHYIGGWIIKAFFLPLMFIYMLRNVRNLAFDSDAPGAVSLDLVTRTLFHFDYAAKLLYTIDLSFAVVGYLCTLKLLQSNIRTVQPKTLGWVSALACYQPFWSALGATYMAYGVTHISQAQRHWAQISHEVPLLLVAWAAVIFLVLACYAWATVVFGIRFSNLTNRGIIDYGPYYFTKHPAYVTKIIGYALTVAPFVPISFAFGDVVHSFRLTLLLGLVALLYYVRAKTEEVHLWESWAYRRYAVQVRRRQRLWWRRLCFWRK